VTSVHNGDQIFSPLFEILVPSGNTLISTRLPVAQSS
jgi:hypothetical protein